MTRSRALAVLLAALALAACTGATGSPPGGGGRCEAAERASAMLVATSDYGSGTLCELASAAQCAATDRALLSGDTVLAWHDAQTFVALSATVSQDSVSFFALDATGAPPAPLRAISALLPDERGIANARGYVALPDGRGLVARFNQPRLLVVDPRDGTRAAGVDLGPLRGDGAHPRPRRLARVGDELWVTLARLDETQTNPTARGGVARLTLDGATLLDADPAQPGAQALELPFANPLGPLSQRGRSVLLACAGSYARLDGGVVRIDAGTREVSIVAREEQLGGNVDAAIFLDDERALLRVVDRTAGSLEISWTRLVELDLRTGATRDWLRVDEWTLTEPVLGADGLLYVGDRGYEPTRRPHGLRVFDPRTGLERTSAPQPCGLQPYDLLPR